MATKTLLFDLDGTLLPMDLDEFFAAYVTHIARYLAPHGYETSRLVEVMTEAVVNTINNDGIKRNEAVFNEVFYAAYGEEKVKADQPLFDAFYQTAFEKVRQVCGYNPQASLLIKRLKAQGVPLVLATNPACPAVATECRVKWAGLSPEDFTFITYDKNFSYCKPRIEYYAALLERLGLRAEDCLMVGNDVRDDMVARQLGIEVFLLTDCLINRSGEDIDAYPHGDYAALNTFIDSWLG